MMALIPARGGSVRLPGKNLKLFHGLPLIAHSILQAQKSKLDRIVVSTECPEIARVSREFGAETPFVRPSCLATNETTSLEVFRHALDFFPRVKTLVVLQPTSPLRTPDDIQGAIKLFQESQADSVISCRKAAPLSWLVRKRSDGTLQKLGLKGDDAYIPNGAIYVLSSEVVRNGEYWTARTIPYEMPAIRSIDIDTAEDFLMAEVLYSALRALE